MLCSKCKTALERDCNKNIICIKCNKIIIPFIEKSNNLGEVETTHTINDIPLLKNLLS